MTPRECLKDGRVPEECALLRRTFFECKRSLVSKVAEYRYYSLWKHSFDSLFIYNSLKNLVYNHSLVLNEISFTSL